jgi:hypothetical protein
MFFPSEDIQTINKAAERLDGKQPRFLKTDKGFVAIYFDIPDP